MKNALARKNPAATVQPLPLLSQIIFGAPRNDAVWSGRRGWRWPRRRFLLRTGGRAVRGGLCALLLCGSAYAALVSSGLGADMDYKLQKGDAIEISVAGIPELRQRVAVQADGTIAFPLLGALPVVGLTPSELRRQVRSGLANKVFRLRANDGREVSVPILPDEVSAIVVEYRPVYIGGNVAHPGELTYRLDMTVRQALALAGGVDLNGGRAPKATGDVAALSDSYDIAMLELASNVARVARLRSELKGQDTFDIGGESAGGLPKAQFAEIAANEFDALTARIAEYRHERDYLSASIAQGEEQLAVVSKQMQAEEQGAEADKKDLQALTSLLANGHVTSLRVNDARRAFLVSSSRLLQTKAQFLQLKKKQTDAVRQLERFDEQRQVVLRKELQEASAAANASWLKRDSIGRKLRVMGLERVKFDRDDDKSPSIWVIRKDERGRSRMAVDEDFALSPGDVVEISVDAPPPSAWARAGDPAAKIPVSGSADSQQGDAR